MPPRRLVSDLPTFTNIFILGKKFEYPLLFDRYRLVILEMKAMVGLLHLADFALYAPFTASDDILPLHYKEAAHVTMRLKPGEAAGGVLPLSSYRISPHGNAELLGATPKAWVLEGLTSEYE